jgi:hypothetical protein
MRATLSTPECWLATLIFYFLHRDSIPVKPLPVVSQVTGPVGSTVSNPPPRTSGRA